MVKKFAGIAVLCFSLIGSSVSAAVYTHTYSGAKSGGSATLNGWFTIDDSAPIGVPHPNFVQNVHIIDFHFEHSVLGVAGRSAVDETDYTTFSGGISGIVTGGSGALTSFLGITLYAGGQINTTGGWFYGTWSSYKGTPPTVPAPAAIVPALTSSLLLLLLAAWRRRRSGADAHPAPSRRLADA